MIDLLNHILTHELSTVRSGLCKDKKSGEIFRFCQNQAEIKVNMAILLPIKESDKDVIYMSDADAVIFGLPWGSKLTINTHLYDMHFYDILKIYK